MRCYIENITTEKDIVNDVKVLIPEPVMRRRMSRIVKQSVATAVECMKGVDNIEKLDAIITATGLGCLADSEKFLRNIIVNDEELLNPTPFIQSTFNTVGGSIALLKHNHCYNVTYVNREHSFEDALLDAMMIFSENEAENILTGAFDERTDSQYYIMKRMGAYRKYECGEGSMFAHLTKDATVNSCAKVESIDFVRGNLSIEECARHYSAFSDSEVMHNDYSRYGIYPTSSSRIFAEAVSLIKSGRREVVILNEYPSSYNSVIVLQCIG